MPAIERSLWVLLVASLGCAADAYPLGALGDDGSGGGSMGSAGSEGTADGETGGDGPFVDPLQGASPIKVYQDEGLSDVVGGLWDAEAGRLLVADAAADAVLRVDLAGTTSQLMPAGGPRGLALDGGDLLVAQAGARQVARASAEGDLEVLAGDLGEPHAIAAADTGTLYVTDAAQGGVLRIDPEGTVGWAATELMQPQGIAFDPQRGWLVVGERGTGRVLTYDVMADGSLAEPQTLTTASAPLMGVCIDDESNVYAVGDAGLEVFAPDGSSWGTVESPAPLTDCSFGRSGPGVLLLLTSPTAVYGIDLRVDGPP